MATETDRLVTVIEVKDNGSVKIREARGEVEKFGKEGSRSFAGVRTSYLAMAAAITAGGYSVKKVFDFGRAGAQVKQLEAAFRRLGGTSSDLEKLSESVRGTVDDNTLIRFSNMANALGINREQFTELTRVARAASDVLGIDVNYAIESVATGTARQSKLWLDNLGIIVSVEEAQARYASQLGKTTGQLTEYEKKQAFINETIRKGTDLIGKAGDEGSAVDSYDKLATAFKNAKDEGLSLLDDVISPMVDALLQPLPEGTMGAMLFGAGGFERGGFVPEEDIKRITALANAMKTGGGGGGGSTAAPQETYTPDSSALFAAQALGQLGGLSGSLQDANAVTSAMESIHEQTMALESEQLQERIALRMQYQQDLREMETLGAQQTMEYYIGLANKEVELEKWKQEQKREITEGQLNANNILKDSYNSLYGSVTQALMAFGATQKAGFVLQRAGAAATAYVHGMAGAAAALAPPPVGLGPIAGLALSKKIALMTKLNVAAILATSFAKPPSGANSGGAGASGTLPVSGEPAPPQVTVYIKGGGLENLIDQINTVVEQNDVQLISTKSLRADALS